MPLRPKPKSIENTYLLLTLLTTLATSFIWGINTLFLLDAGLSNAQAFLANAFFTAGQVLFEVPTGIVADIRGRRASYLVGAVTLAAATLLYWYAWTLHAPMWLWALSSILLGLGYTFFSGATEAWLVDALNYARYKGQLEAVFAKAQAIGGAAMLVGSVAGGYIAQHTDLGVPYLIRAGFLLAAFAAAFILMRDWGFAPAKSVNLGRDVRTLFATSIDLGLRKPSIRWVMLAAPFSAGVGFYVFYAAQPHLLNLYGDASAYGVAGLAAAIVAGAQIIGGIAAPWVRKLFKLRTSVLLVGQAVSVALLLALGVVDTFWGAVLLLCLWGLTFAALSPVRQAYLNNLIPSQQRATVLSFDSLLSSAGGMFSQPYLGGVADAFGYFRSFTAGALIHAVAVPLTWLAQRQEAGAAPHKGKPARGR